MVEPGAGTLGRLEQVQLRDYWEREDTDFTPWLASEENIALLGDAIGIELEVQEQEARVGPFRADILCRESATGHLVVVENQLERTDHSHLGQILTYAAGLGAVTVVWIAARFTDEHRAALDWLNNVTREEFEEFSFFGIEVELFRIGNSVAAPKFDIVSTPNGWTKRAREAASLSSATLTATQQLQLEYWEAFGQRLGEASLRIRPVKPQPTNWLSHGIGRSDFILVTYVNVRDSRVGVGLSVVGSDSEPHFRLLEREKPDIERELGFAPEWQFKPDRKEQKIIIRKPATPRDRATWPELQAWTVARVADFERAFGRRIRQLDASAWVESDD